MPSHLSLDHIIILVPYADLQSPPHWITSNFTLTPGGRHADGKTENKLICFKDGSYLELIAFINDDPELRKGHWWDKPFGIVDFAFTSADATVNYTDIQARLEAIENCEARYEPPVEGARKRPDGVEVKWQVTFPKVGEGFQRGELPFFCHDITERSLRVPSANTTHPSFAYGIKSLFIYVPKEKVKRLARAYSAILDTPNTSVVDGFGYFEVQRGVPVEGALETVEFVIQPPGEEWQIKAMEERGGLLLGDMIVGGISMRAPQGIRIDVDEKMPDGGFGIGRVMRSLDLPLGYQQDEGDGTLLKETTPPEGGNDEN